MSKRAPLNPKSAIGYLRVSTDDQKLGPQAQRDAIEAWAKREGVNVVSWFEDHGVSGAANVDDRPGLLQALSALRELGAGVLIVAKRDRIARDVVIAATVERVAAKAGAKVQSADGTGNGDTPADAFMRTILDGAAAYERALIRGRTKAALQTKKKRGERIGVVPFGFQLKADGPINPKTGLPRDVEPNAAEQAVIDRIHQLRADGLSQRQIIAQLAAEGVVGRTGKPLALTQVQNILEREAVAA